MYLSDIDKRVIYGEGGLANQFSMQILIRLGEIYGAKRMVPIKSAHVGCVYPQFGAAIEIMKKVDDLEGEFCVPTTANPVLNPINFNKWNELNEPLKLQKLAKKQIAYVLKMGAIPVWTCTPYFEGNLPHYGEMISWEESSAVIFANSVLGARSNRTTIGVDIASSIVGRVPEYGLLLDRNRKANILIKLNFEPKSLFEYGTLGYIIGKLCGGKIPVIENLPESTNVNHLKVLGSSMATKGGISIFHAVGITPEARTKEEAFQNTKPEFEYAITRKNIKDSIIELNTAKNKKVDAIAIGCPHAGIEEIKELAILLSGKKVNKDLHFCIFSSERTIELAKKMKFVNIIKGAGAKIFPGSCLVFQSTKLWGWKSVATNSAKYALTLPSEPNELEVYYTSLEECVDLAVR